MKERAMQEEQWKAVSPKHYKEIVPGFEYMDMMCYMLEDFEGVESHLIGQIYKYLMRLGKKDGKEQEIGKVFWYTCYLMIEEYKMDPEKLVSTLKEIEHRKERG